MIDLRIERRIPGSRGSMMTLSIPAALAAVLFSASVASAAEADRPAEQQAVGAPDASPPVANMRVEIWPEYDDPRVLVIYRGDLAPSERAPTSFRLTIPAEAQVHMAGAVDPRGGHIHALYETRERDDGLVDISYTLEVPNFYVEFYYNPFSGHDERDFTYPLVAPSRVDKLVVSVQHPRRAQGFGVSPFTDQVVQDAEGLLYHVIERADVAGGSFTPVTVSYTKTDREPSVARQDTGTGGGTSNRRAMEYILAFAAVLLVGVGAYVLFSRSLGRPTDEHPEGARARGARGRGLPTGHTSRFCTRCGQPVTSDDRFCGMCGHPTQGPGTHVTGGAVTDFNPAREQA